MLAVVVAYGLLQERMVCTPGTSQQLAAWTRLRVGQISNQRLM